MNEEVVGLTQEEVDVLASHLEDQEIKEVKLFDILEKLPDAEHGEGEIPEDFGAYCVLCEEQFTEEDDDVGERFGKFVHISCAKEQDPDVEVKEGEL